MGIEKGVPAKRHDKEVKLGAVKLVLEKGKMMFVKTVISQAMLNSMKKILLPFIGFVLLAGKTFSLPCEIVLQDRYCMRCFDDAFEIVQALQLRNLLEKTEILLVSNLRRFDVHVIVNSDGWIWDPINRNGNNAISPMPFDYYFDHYSHGRNPRVRVLSGSLYLAWYTDDTNRLIDINGRKLEPGPDLLPGFQNGYDFLPFGQELIEKLNFKFPIIPLSKYLQHRRTISDTSASG